MNYWPQIGDAVRYMLDESVLMTVYDIDDKKQVAHCNWLIGHQMRKLTVPYDTLKPAKRPTYGH